MAIAGELIEVAQSTSIGSGGGNLFVTFALLTFLILLFGVFMILLITLRNRNRYNINANILVPTNSGHKIIKARAGVIPNRKTGKPEFVLKKPFMVINNYNPEWVISSGSRKRNARDECYLINTSLNKYEMLNPIVVRENGESIVFVAKNIGKDRLSELMDSQIEELFTLENFMSKYGVHLFYGSMVMVQIIMCIVLVQASNKILGA